MSAFKNNANYYYFSFNLYYFSVVSKKKISFLFLSVYENQKKNELCYIHCLIKIIIMA